MNLELRCTCGKAMEFRWDGHGCWRATCAECGTEYQSLPMMYGVKGKHVGDIRCFTDTDAVPLSITVRESDLFPSKASHETSPR